MLSQHYKHQYLPRNYPFLSGTNPDSTPNLNLTRTQNLAFNCKVLTQLVRESPQDHETQQKDVQRNSKTTMAFSLILIIAFFLSLTFFYKPHHVCLFHHETQTDNTKKKKTK
ncbi:uncharacterized protein DS421_18g615400 [Arachis hypogaea]|nr:uncharacterized protein DS421_18g615400 [Arachis hypogaea]